MPTRLILLVMLLLCPLSQAAPTDVGEGREPQLAPGPDHRVYLTYGRGNEIHFAASEDGGRTFANDVTVAAPPALSLGMRRGPRVVAGDGFVLVTAIAGAKGRGQDGDLLAWRSTDAGRHWTGPTKVNDTPAAAREGLHAVASDGGRRVYATWLDLRTGHTRIQGSLSRDGGVTWEANEVIYQSPDGHVCECCHPSVTFLKDGQVAVMFRNFLAGDRDMHLATFTPGTANAGSVHTQKLDAESWKLNACPMDGGALTTDMSGNEVAVWQNKGKIHLSYGKITPEKCLGEGVQPTVTTLPTGPAVAWTTSRTGQLLYLPPIGPPVPVADHATNPVLITSDGRPICAWTANNRILVDVMPPVASN